MTDKALLNFSRTPVGLPGGRDGELLRMNVLGIGVDLVECARIQRSIDHLAPSLSRDRFRGRAIQAKPFRHCA